MKELPKEKKHIKQCKDMLERGFDLYLKDVSVVNPDDLPDATRDIMLEAFAEGGFAVASNAYSLLEGGKTKGGIAFLAAITHAAHEIYEEVYDRGQKAIAEKDFLSKALIGEQLKTAWKVYEEGNPEEEQEFFAFFHGVASAAAFFRAFAKGHPEMSLIEGLSVELGHVALEMAGADTEETKQ